MGSTNQMLFTGLKEMLTLFLGHFDRSTRQVQIETLYSRRYGHCQMLQLQKKNDKLYFLENDIYFYKIVWTVKDGFR
jgi:hypothetical protein